MEINELFMHRCCELAQRGIHSVSPNPMVGVVVVCDEKILSEGWHEYYGGKHAEVNALGNISDKNLLPYSTLYINLEPCNHTGNTPPCTDAIIESGIKQVVIGCKDPNPLVSGKGIEKLKSSDIEVLTGCCETLCKELNKKFFTFITLKRPYILLKWAQTKDGFIAKKDFSSKWISSELSRLWVHKLRSQTDTIGIGYNTAKYDNPLLTSRNWSIKNPVRWVIDRDLSLPANLNLFNGVSPTIVYNGIENRIKSDSIELKQIDFDAEILPQILQDLYDRKFQSLLVEGGGSLLNQFISKNLWDEAWVFESEQVFREGIKAPSLDCDCEIKKIGSDKLFFFTATNCTN